MKSYRVKMKARGEIALPAELQNFLGLMPGDYLEIRIDPEGKLNLCTAERSVGPLSDFFEDFILNDLHKEGCSGDLLQTRYLERKIQLSTVLDRLSEEARLSLSQGHTLWWREIPILDNGHPQYQSEEWKVFLTSRAERNLIKLQGRVLKEIPQVMLNLEHDPLEFKRLNGPYYSIHRVSLASEISKHYRVIYTVFPEEKAVEILTVGERKEIYDFLKGMAL
ncbi:MAG: hypothetical protein APF84_05350 [Gracilibacter sp. BRH_c7a]|nr:MAG: hypothetical protein APF84_05350 [Gracilibacter sp. BRH_c7a]